MKVAYATIFALVLWLIVATPYWKPSHRVSSHTLWIGYSSCCYANTHKDKPTSKVVPPCFYASPYWNLMYLIKTPTHLEHLTQQYTNLEYNNSKVLHFWIANSCCYKTNSSKLYKNQSKHFIPKTNIQIGPQLILWNGFGIGIIRSKDLVNPLQKSSHSFEHCICHKCLHPPMLLPSLGSYLSKMLI